ncbi:hypothetical protein ACFQPA_05560 [Halomarina halobia]|uniref:t-SNARE coiled-coil homology domain-containing protein n=1 Tax=Halomarina halobia TaxID=3033386 RepID=A0ABD6A5K0_9EURY|nr:hypothetical protein [Halomarina sp. PSR21]
MSAAETDIVTVEEGGISVEKSFAPDEFSVPAIAFALENARDDPVAVRLVDDLPDGVSPDDVGFHPEYGEDYWSVEDDRLVFERRFDPAETYTTVYGLRAADLDSVERFLVEPTLEAMDPAAAILPDNAQVVRDVLSGDADTVPGLGEEDGGGKSAEAEEGEDGRSTESEDGKSDEGTEGDADDEPIQPLQLVDPNILEDDADGGSDVVAAPTAGSFAATLAAELEAGNVDDETKSVLASHLGGATGSVDARIERLQVDVSDLLAYTDALEAFLDENGEGQQLLADLREELESLEGRVRSIEDRSTSNRDGVREVTGRVDDVESGVERVESEAERIRETVADLEARIETVADLEARIETVAGDAVAEADLDDLRSRVDDLAALADELESVGDRLDALDERVAEVETEIDAFEGFRERMARVFGAADNDDDNDG